MSTRSQKLRLLTHWLRETPWTRTLVFTRTKHGADKVAKSLLQAGIQADAFHSNKSQSARQRVLLRFKSPQPLVLVATDIAARGLDIDHVSHVINFDLPVDAESYIHRIGRTGRAGAAGVAVSFCDHGEARVAGHPAAHAANAGGRAAPAGMPGQSEWSYSARLMAPAPAAASASSRPGYAKRFSGQRRGASVRRAGR